MKKISNKSEYKKPILNKMGSVKNLTLKTGSIADFGSNKYAP